MIIRSDSVDSYIEIRSIEGDEYHHFLKASLVSNTLENDYLVFTNSAQFITELRDLEKNRQGRASLVGTEDFEMVIEPDGGSGAIWLQLSLRKAFFTMKNRSGHVKAGNASLIGGFSVSGEFVAKILSDFSALFHFKESENPDEHF